MNRERSRVLGIGLDPLTADQVLACCEEAIAARETLLIGMVNVAKLVKMQSAPELREAVTGSNLVLPDGLPVVWASRVLGCPLPERIAGIDLFMRLLERGSARGYSVYMLGAKNEVIESAVRIARERYPGVQIAGYRDGYFGDDAIPAILAEIRDSGADMLFVGMSSPRKELFLARYGRTIGIPVCHGVGGSFDVLAGKVVRAPRLYQRFGLEWLHRLFQEPRRMWKRYLVTNTLFLYLLTRELMGWPRPLR